MPSLLTWTFTFRICLSKNKIMQQLFKLIDSDCLGGGRTKVLQSHQSGNNPLDHPTSGWDFHLCCYSLNSSWTFCNTFSHACKDWDDYCHMNHAQMELKSYMLLTLIICKCLWGLPSRLVLHRPPLAKTSNEHEMFSSGRQQFCSSSKRTAPLSAHLESLIPSEQQGIPLLKE